MFNMKITYYHTLYKKNVTEIVAHDIQFKNESGETYVYFAASGHRYRVNAKYVVKVEADEE